MFVRYNANPSGDTKGDCVIRALCVVFDDTWRHIYADLTMMGYYAYDMPNANVLLAKYLTLNGFVMRYLPDTCPDCYTVRDFVHDHPYGTYVVSTGCHVIAVVDGAYYDTSDTGNHVPVYYFERM